MLTRGFACANVITWKRADAQTGDTKMTATFTHKDADRADEIFALRKRMFLAERRTDSDRAEFADIEARARAVVVGIYGDDKFSTGDETDALQVIYFAAIMAARAA